MTRGDNPQDHKAIVLTALEQDSEALAEHLVEVRAADIAELLEELVDQQDDMTGALVLLENLPLIRRSHVYGHLPSWLQESLVDRLSDRALLEILEEMSADDRADLYNLLEIDRREALLRRMAHRKREELRRLASYEEGTAGAVMTSDYVAIPSGLTAAQALMRVRQTAPDAETVYQLYVLDEHGHLAGTWSLRQLLIARPSAYIDDLMIKDVIRTQVDTPQEEVARLVARYDLLAVPVVDEEERMVGIVTHDDVLDVVQAEATEDIHKGASVGTLEKGVGRTSLWSLYRKRIVWLVLLVFGNLFSGAGIAYFEDIIAAQVALVFFLPLLIDSGGNAGAQASTLTVRGLATGDIAFKDWGKLLGRELLIAIALGLTMALAVSPIGFLRGGEMLMLVVAMSMTVIVLIGSLVGLCLPFILDRLGWDPATASGPLVTTLIDSCGVLIYFSIATLMLANL
ncbi:magnesium transporter [Halomonas sp. PR-M31]|uniref:magnesium transporter n=1 Tax=Halomonas sp. PR-M31 TaxID=1471202 RepID=UPI000651EAA0|nr:magnesium transporter [Halomonas sp. PR-M31]